jgi:hypothetical protein
VSYKTKVSGGAITLLQVLARGFIFMPMQQTAFRPPIGSSDLEADPTFNVLIAYEDFETGKHAKETYDFLVSNLRHECQFSNQMWKFDVLGIPKLREMAAKDALTADIIIISCHATHDLSADVKAWFNSWIDEQSNAIALVALFFDTSASSDNHNMHAYLANVAKRARMEFFAQPNSLPVKGQDEAFTTDRGTKRDERALSALAGVIQRDQSFPHWGINE